VPLNVSQLSLNRTLTRWQLGRVSPYLPKFADIRLAEHGDTPLQS
jgi:hypothetical protein